MRALVLLAARAAQTAVQVLLVLQVVCVGCCARAGPVVLTLAAAASSE